MKRKKDSFRFVPLIHLRDRTMLSGQTKPDRDNDACSFLAQNSDRERISSKSSVNSREMASGVSQPGVIAGWASRVPCFRGGAVESEELKE